MVKQRRISVEEVCHKARGLLASQASPQQILIRRSITHNTAKLYAGRVAFLKTFATRMGFPAVTKDCFLLFVASYIDGSEGGATAAQYRAALLHEQRASHFDLLAGDPARGLPPESPWADDADVILACKGARYNNRVCTAPDKKLRGFVSEEMFLKLHAWLLLQQDGAQWAAAFTVQFYASLRPCEVSRILGGDLCMGPLPSLIVRTNKLESASRICGSLLDKPLSQEQASIIQGQIGWVPHGQLAFPAHTPRRAAELIRRAAQDLGWPANVHFDGSHTLRHGGAQVAVEAAVDIVRAAVAGMSTTTQRRHYLRPRGQR